MISEEMQHLKVTITISNMVKILYLILAIRSKFSEEMVPDFILIQIGYPKGLLICYVCRVKHSLAV